jgi:hypothetical protein
MDPDVRLYPTVREEQELEEYLRSERRERRRRDRRKMQVSGAGVKRVYKDAVLKRAGRAG